MEQEVKNCITYTNLKAIKKPLSKHVLDNSNLVTPFLKSINMSLFKQLFQNGFNVLIK